MRWIARPTLLAARQRFRMEALDRYRDDEPEKLWWQRTSHQWRRAWCADQPGRELLDPCLQESEANLVGPRHLADIQEDGRDLHPEKGRMAQCMALETEP